MFCHFPFDLVSFSNQMRCVRVCIFAVLNGSFVTFGNLQVCAKEHAHHFCFCACYVLLVFFWGL
eukprot:m.223511 g.223511  ORF g.223511 m.223511 type:complete len:64 (+) comp33403_c1_seq1:103-294(+)